jgi:hypothetical protein
MSNAIEKLVQGGGSGYFLGGTSMSTFESSEAWSVAMDLLTEPGAEQRLLHAVQTALETKNLGLEAEARLALGIFWQHLQKNGEAKRELERAMELGVGSEADRHCGETYLKAIGLGYRDGSFTESELVAGSIRDYVMSRLPEGLISDLVVSVDLEGGVRTHLEVERDLSEEEIGIVHAMIDEAVRAHDVSATPVNTPGVSAPRS